MMRRASVWVLALGLVACSADEDEPSGGAGAAGGSAGAAGGGGLAGAAGSSAGAGGAAGMPGHPKSLPFDFERADVGSSVSAAELQAATDVYLDLLEKTRWFDLVDERVHGWPESDPQGRYWYGTWWSGVNLLKSGGRVTYQHGENGGDNNGLRTGPLLEGLCFAHRAWGDAKTEHLVRRVVRGFTSWIMAMERTGADDGVLLTRASYPSSIDSNDGGRSFRIDYDLNHPGLDNGATEYVRVPDNPHWGDVWVKNKRSKDDIGHMLRAIGQMDTCAGTFAESGAEDDLEDMKSRYGEWARRVEDDGWKIATYDKAGALWFPTDLLANFVLVGNAECDAMLALRLTGRGEQGDLDCGNGIGSLDSVIIGTNDQNGEILRSFHEAAIVHALLSGRAALAKALLEGLTVRVDEGMDGYEAGTPPTFLGEQDFADLLMHSANLGVPLTSREVRWLHGAIRRARDSYSESRNDPIYRIFDASTPDGAYAYQPSGEGLHFRSIALAMGTCFAQYRNPTSRPVLDCARLASWR